LQEEYKNLFLDEILSFLSKTNLENIPSVSIYHQITKIFLDADNRTHYYKLKNLLEQYSMQFPGDEVYDMYTHALNYCNRMLRSGNLDFVIEMLDLYKTLIKKGIIFDNGYLEPNKVKNIISLSILSGQITWAEEFINEYKERFTPEFRESTYIYNLASLYYAKKEFSKALKLLQTVELNDIYYHLDSKLLLLKTYYELDEAEPFFSLIDAFTNYLKRNKLISENSRTAYLNFVRYAKKIMQMRLGGRLKPQEVREELKKLTLIGNVQWLNEKLDELEALAARHP
jgi:hypothetical protein